NIKDFFSSEEFSVDIFQNTLIKKFYGQGSVIKINENEANEIKNSLVIGTLPQVQITAKDFREFIYKVYESEKRIALEALKSGKNIIFIGPPGSGKTVLAIKVSEEFSNENNGNGYLLYTVHSGTDYFDLVARIIPSLENDKLVYKKEKRYLLEALLGKKVLILDEINRTQIDTALGIFFTYLEMEHRVQHTDKIKEVIERETGENMTSEELKDKLEFFRVIGTLNVYDKTFLFKLGDALRRRFVFINIGTPKEKMNIVKENFETFLKCIDFEGEEKFARRLLSIFERINEKKELGIGILKEFILFSMNYEEEQEAIEKSLIHTILHFFENDPKWLEIEEILKEEKLDNAREYLRSLNYGFPTS
ncbi:MAG: AAA family ATPase, partial [Candidatus Micrarchaeia archaeon]